MREIKKYDIKSPIGFADNITRYIETLDCGIILRSNSYLSKKDKHSVRSSYDFLAGLGAITIIKHDKDRLELLRKDFNRINDWIFGYIGYDIKNEIEQLTSNNFDGLGFNDLFFFQPKIVMNFKEDKLNVKYTPEITPVEEIDALVAKFDFESDDHDFTSHIKQFKRRFSKDEYIEDLKKENFSLKTALNKIKDYIERKQKPNHEKNR